MFWTIEVIFDEEKLFWKSKISFEYTLILS